MATQRVFDQPMPSPDEIRAAIRRAHHKRSQALSRMLVALFFAYRSFYGMRIESTNK